MAFPLARLSGLLCLSIAGCGGSAMPAADPTPERPDVTAPAPPPGSDPAPPAAPHAPPVTAGSATPDPTPSGADLQIARGQKLYAEACANCHGTNGRGGKSPALVGLAQGALPLAPPKTAKYRKVSFKTAADVRDFLVQTMPPTEPESLAPDDAHAVLAFLLRENAVAWGDDALDATAAARLEIPRP